MRHGYFFQNRYQSIECDEDAYCRELVRYIHLNPLQAGLVKDLAFDMYTSRVHKLRFVKRLKIRQD